ncbi:hypothetical protein CTAYLR_008908 [Chrysophaeum taylorii]|uniref:Uncharacterized protein n=1 Tax=Chrysophaeum taylorii TaxID=2483200 RepID=A0AAD7UI94_9STRA|nr:hypothetical protein CTAYLR_008908 [Chrysophaeum taylorii]
MITADVAQLESSLHQLTLQIREKELSVFTRNLGVLGTKATFLCGLGFSGLTMVPSWQRSSAPTRLALASFYTLDSLSIAFNLSTITLATWCMIFGPALAIRGPTGSMSRAIGGLFEERRVALRLFWLGNLFILLASIALGWVKFDRDIAISITLVLVSFILALAYYITQVTAPRFQLSEAQNLATEQRYADAKVIRPILHNV